MHVACSTRYLKFLPFSAGEEIKFNKYSGECTLGGPDWFLWVSLKDLGGKLCPITILLIQTWGLRYSSEKRVSICLSPPLFGSLSPTLPLSLYFSPSLPSRKCSCSYVDYKTVHWQWRIQCFLGRPAHISNPTDLTALSVLWFFCETFPNY